MGILDSIFNGSLTPEQSQGLLAAAAQVLQASGPSRTPQSFGQILGGGLQALQQAQIDAEGRQLQRQQQGLNSKLLGLKIQDAESDLAKQKADRERAAKLADFYQKDALGQAGTVPTPSSAVSALIDQVGNAAPTVDNAATLATIQAMQSPQQQISNGGQRRQSLFEQRMAQADRLRAAGFGPEADATEKAALAFQPKVKGWEKVQQNGKVMFAPYFEDGTSGAPVPLEVAEKLEKVDLGGAQQLVNPFTGSVVTSTKKTASPSDVIARERLNFEQSQANRPVFNAEAGGFIERPTAQNPNGRLINVPGLNNGGKLTEDQAKATGWLVQASQAYNNLSKVAFDKNGGITDAAKPGLADAVASIPGAAGTGNYFRTPERQKFIQGASSLSEALLRAATGAGVNRDEAQQKIAELTPQFGDSEDVIRQKFDAIPAYIETLKVRSGKGAQQASDVLSRTAPAQQPANGSKRISLADIAETARRSGKTTAEVTAAAKAKGYTIGGE